VIESPQRGKEEIPPQISPVVGVSSILFSIEILARAVGDSIRAIDFPELKQVKQTKKSPFHDNAEFSVMPRVN
jgi:hypothetical protein